MLPSRSGKNESPSSKQPLLHEEVLANGLRLFCREAGNRYFGDYHRVVVAVEIHLPLDHHGLGQLDPALLARARARYGATLVTHKTLERMGVAGAEVTQVQQDLLASFLKQAHAYLARLDMPARMLVAELERQRPSVHLSPRQ